MRKHLILAVAAVCVMTVAGCAGTDTGTGGSISGESSQTALENSQQTSRETVTLSDSGNIDSAAESDKNKTDNAQQNAVSLTLDEAKAIALEKAGVSEKDVVFTETSFEYDDGVACYQIDFISGTTEYEIEIDANSGEIIEYEAESVYD